MKTLNDECIPLFQTIVWIILIVFILAINKTLFSRLITSLSVRLEKGSSVKSGSFELGEIKNQINSVKNEISSGSDLISRLFLTF
jgi:hypothetical protein